MKDRAVITGVGVVCSAGADAHSFAGSLRSGRRGARRVETTPSGTAVAVARLERFCLEDALARAGLPDHLTATAIRLVRRSPFPMQTATAAAVQAWACARLHEAAFDPARLSVVVAGSNLSGRYSSDVVRRLAEGGAQVPARFALHSLDTDHVGTLSHLFGIRGEGATVGAASASGTAALIHAARLVEWGQADACLVVGVSPDLSAAEMQGYVGIGAMAPVLEGEDGEDVPSPFDQRHRGFVYGQGAAALVVESAESAARRTAPPVAAVAGYATGLDSNGLADPSVEGEARVMTGALADAGIRPDDVCYVNAHGTGSPLGDATEAAAIECVFRPGGSRGPVVNSTKSIVGHLLAGAGVLEAAATVIQLGGGFVHPNAGIETPMATGCGLAGPSVSALDGDYAVSNSFGFGGFNTSVVLKRAGRATLCGADAPGG